MKESAISAELKRLADAYGGELQPEAVVEAARDAASPLHDSFEWNDSDAAARYRLHQARHLIRAAVTYERVAPDRLVPCRVFVSLTDDRGKDRAGYRLMATVLSDDERRRQLLIDAKDEMGRFSAKYRTLQELAGVFSAMDRASDLIDAAEHEDQRAAASA